MRSWDAAASASDPESKSDSSSESGKGFRGVALFCGLELGTLDELRMDARVGMGVGEYVGIGMVGSPNGCNLVPGGGSSSSEISTTGPA